MASDKVEGDDDSFGVDEPAQPFLLAHERMGQSSAATATPATAATAAAGQRQRGGTNVTAATASRAPHSESAIDDAEEVTSQFAMMQIARDRQRREAELAAKRQAAFPFKFSPLLRPLGLSDVDACVALENAAFTEPTHRATREKFNYRLSIYPEFSVGLFCTVEPAKVPGWDMEPFLSSARPVETSRANGAVSVLLAHVVATKSPAPVVTDMDLSVPEGWHDWSKKKQTGPLDAHNKIVHREDGRTVKVHSLCVVPQVQGLGLGRMIAKDFLYRMAGSGIADRVALLSQEYNVDFYLRLGFKNLGKSQVQFAGGNWYDMVFDLSTIKLF